MGSEVKFTFASRLDIEMDRLNLVSAKTKYLNSLKQELKYKRIASNSLTNYCNPRLLLSIINLLILFVPIFQMLSGIGKNILLLYLMSRISLKGKFLLNLGPFK
jgi:hypothetical protein